MNFIFSVAVIISLSRIGGIEKRYVDFLVSELHHYLIESNIFFIFITNLINNNIISLILKIIRSLRNERKSLE